MKLNIEEKKILYAFGCENLENTIRRLKWITALTVDTKVKHRFCVWQESWTAKMLENSIPAFAVISAWRWRDILKRRSTSALWKKVQTEDRKTA